MDQRILLMIDINGRLKGHSDFSEHRLNVGEPPVPSRLPKGDLGHLLHLESRNSHRPYILPARHAQELKKPLASIKSLAGVTNGLGGAATDPTFEDITLAKRFNLMGVAKQVLLVYTNCGCVNINQHIWDNIVGVISKEYLLPAVTPNLHRPQGFSDNVHRKHSQLLTSWAHSLRHFCIVLCKPNVRCEV